MRKKLLEAIEASDVETASALFRREKQENPLDIHDSLYPIVQQVLNPPFINPHLPKMFNICRDLFPYLETDEILNLVSLEIHEYARRPKMKRIVRSPNSVPLPATQFSDIASAIRDRDVNRTA